LLTVTDCFEVIKVRTQTFASSGTIKMFAIEEIEAFKAVFNNSFERSLYKKASTFSGILCHRRKVLQEFKFARTNIFL
jgi:hypothetical protein